MVISYDEYYSVMNRNEVPTDTTWINPENITAK